MKQDHPTTDLALLIYIEDSGCVLQVYRRMNFSAWMLLHALLLSLQKLQVHIRYWRRQSSLFGVEKVQRSMQDIFWTQVLVTTLSDSTSWANWYPLALSCWICIELLQHQQIGAVEAFFCCSPSDVFQVNANETKCCSVECLKSKGHLFFLYFFPLLSLN